MIDILTDTETFDTIIGPNVKYTALVHTPCILPVLGVGGAAIHGSGRLSLHSVWHIDLHSEINTQPHQTPNFNLIV